MKEADVFLDDNNITKTENNEDDDEEKESIPDPDDIFAHFLIQTPGLDITSDMSEEEITAKLASIEMLHQAIVEQYNKKMEELKERKRQRKEERRIRHQKEKEERIEREKQMENPEMPVTKQLISGNLFVIRFEFTSILSTMIVLIKIVSHVQLTDHSKTAWSNFQSC